MRKARLLSTVAATLLLTVGVASAQDMKKGEAPAPAPAAQQTAPAEKVAPAMKPGEKKAGAQKAPETTGQAPKASDADKSRASDQGQIKSETTDKAGSPGTAAKSSPDANGSADVKAKSDNSAASKSTTGQGAAAGSAKLSTEQHAKVTTIFKQNKVEPARLSVAVTVGTRVPTSVHFYPVPVEVITIYPAWRGYDYILVGDQIVIIDPRTHEIVAIIEA